MIFVLVMMSDEQLTVRGFSVAGVDMSVMLRKLLKVMHFIVFFLALKTAVHDLYV